MVAPPRTRGTPIQARPGGPLAAGGPGPATPASMASLLRDFRAGRLELFAPPGKPGSKSAPAKDRARAQVIELRREGPSAWEVSARLCAKGTPPNRTGAGQTLAKKASAGCCAVPAPPSAPARPPRPGHAPARAAVIDFAPFPACAKTRLAGLPLALPDLVSLDLPALITAAGPGYATGLPGTLQRQQHRRNRHQRRRHHHRDPHPARPFTRPAPGQPPPGDHRSLMAKPPPAFQFS